MIWMARAQAGASTIHPANERQRLLRRRSVASTSLFSWTTRSHVDAGHPRSLVPASLSLHGTDIIRRLASRGLFSLVDHSKTTTSDNTGLDRTLDDFLGSTGKRVEQVINSSAERIGRGPTAFTARFLDGFPALSMQEEASTTRIPPRRRFGRDVRRDKRLFL
ncbi:hypothetical protein NEOLEDRAFT_495631 [Neolentinus lepideus HHB14362 ss-1]|uniref:Uncharacterized protein n=1 Tax=Neolentinus lepideus HHB14362 ss-1 TaxID=1314782 RepID=A0A165RMR9_9AGAM|nr:hypothetical protein NEOLEDRAFT_495631 [Neolentinus lepideus HHB14362 ss-1]